MKPKLLYFKRENGPRKIPVSIENRSVIGELVEVVKERFALKGIADDQISFHVNDVELDAAEEFEDLIKKLEKNTDPITVKSGPAGLAGLAPPAIPAPPADGSDAGFKGKDYRLLSLPDAYQVAHVRPKTPPRMENLPLGWPVVSNAARDRIKIALKMENCMTLMTGRRRIGKTHEVLSVCKELHDNGFRILFIEAKEALDAFHRSVCDSLSAFDHQIQPPWQNVDDIFGLLWWLMRSGVLVVIDEIQRLYVENKGFFTGFKTACAFHGPLKGSFFGFGSHVTEVVELINSSSPMYAIGVAKLDFLPPTPRQILRFLKELGVPEDNWLSVYSFSGRIIGKLSDFLKVASPNMSFPIKASAAACLFNTKALITHMEGEPEPFEGELGPQLGSFLTSLASFKTEDCTVKSLPTKMLSKFGFKSPQLVSFLKTLEKHAYIQKKWPLSRQGRKLSGEARFTIVDTRLRMGKAFAKTQILSEKVDAWNNQEGNILEGLVNQIIDEAYENDENVVVETANGYWKDKGQAGVAEIDVVVRRKMWGYLWGTIKRNPNDLSASNFSTHLDNVLQKLDGADEQNHGFIYISAVLDETSRSRLQQGPVQIGGEQKLERDRIQCADLKDLIADNFNLSAIRP